MSDVVVSQPTAPGMITLRYDFAAPGAQSALLGATGCVMPGTRRIAFSGDRALAWMSPDEAMLFLPHAQAPSVAAEIAAKLAPAPCLAVDVSDARVIFRLSGQGAREVLAKGAPADLSPAAFGVGDFRRTRVGQVAAAFWLREDGAFDLMCFRSVAEYMRLWLDTAARPGSLPGYL
ncbi:sarcosine oxidase subunit gamma [uncultured Amaricoccus sp.]|uniref:sarcosine oxidase subunit gamma n=1 Tax=uncultured Amaricoccus sp. TaxID=339341 RepID=UPI00262A3EF3|nr:sarcosine oxidase subunit gamma family protein [uncultured Amaricoccus sp.]